MSKDNTQRRHEQLEKIARKAKEVRAAQRQYFRTRKHEAMQASIKLECELDTMLESLDRLNGYLRAEHPAQAELYGGET